MASKYKLLLLDIDGTTVSSKKDALPSKRVIDAVKRAQDHVHVAVATGRSLLFAQPVIDSLGLHGLGVFMGGAEIIDVTSGETIVRKIVSEPALQELVKLALPFRYEISYDVDSFEKLLASPDDITAPASQLLIAAVAARDVPGLVEMLSAVEGVVAHRTSSWADGDVEDIHVSNFCASKRHGVEKLITLLGCEKRQVMAIGDGYNDIPLLEAAGFKVAMGNAPDEVKAVADHVTASLENDGVAEAIERFILTSD